MQPSPNLYTRLSCWWIQLWEAVGRGAMGFHTLHWKGFWLHEKVGCGLPAKLNTNRFPSGPSLKTFLSVFSEIPFPGSL